MATPTNHQSVTDSRWWLSVAGVTLGALVAVGAIGLMSAASGVLQMFDVVTILLVVAVILLSAYITACYLSLRREH